MKELTVLVTAAGNVFMPGTLACLKNNGERAIRLIGADMSDDSSILQMCDAAYQVPRCSDPSYIDSLLRICEKEKVDVLLPIMSGELNALAENRARFSAVGTAVSVSDADALCVANNKRKLLDYMMRGGLPCAAFYAIHSIEELERCAGLLGYPEKQVCVKATEGSGSRGFRILSEKTSRFHAFLNEKPSSGFVTLSELSSILAEAEQIPELLVMEYLPGAEYTVDLLADQGKVLAACCRKSLRMENSIMLEAVIVDHPQAVALCAKVCESLQLDGNIGFDLRENSAGEALIMECNPRITAGIPYYALAGVNLPYLCIKKLLGEELPPVTPAYGTIIRRRWMEMSA